jgi:hypothetical protein
MLSVMTFRLLASGRHMFFFFELVYRGFADRWLGVVTLLGGAKFRDKTTPSKK